MKKEYIKPSMEVVKLNKTAPLLAGSATPGDIPLGAPGFDWVEKGYEFGGWDLEDAWRMMSDVRCKM